MNEPYAEQFCSSDEEPHPLQDTKRPMWMNSKLIPKCHLTSLTQMTLKTDFDSENTSSAISQGWNPLQLDPTDFGLPEGQQQSFDRGVANRKGGLLCFSSFCSVAKLIDFHFWASPMAFGQQILLEENINLFWLSKNFPLHHNQWPPTCHIKCFPGRASRWHPKVTGVDPLSHFPGLNICLAPMENFFVKCHMVGCSSPPSQPFPDLPNPGWGATWGPHGRGVSQRKTKNMNLIYPGIACCALPFSGFSETFDTIGVCSPERCVA